MKRYLAMEVAGRDYVVEMSPVHSVIRPCPVTPLPFVPPAVLGLINFRSSIIPLGNPAVMLEPGAGNESCAQQSDERAGLASRCGGRGRRRFVVFGRDGRLMALAVDGVDDVVDGDACERVEDVSWLSAVHRRYFDGLVRFADRSAIELNVERLLDDIFE